MKALVYLKKAKLGFRALSLSAPASRTTIARNIIKGRLAAKTMRLRRRLMTAQVRIVQILFGANAAVAFFWKSPTTRKLWGDVEQRLNNLAASHPSAIAKFTRLGFERSHDPIILICLARNIHSREYLAECVSNADLTEGSPVAEKIRISIDYAAAFVGASGLLLEDDAAQGIADLVLARHSNLNLRYHQILDSFGVRPALPPENPALRGVLDSGMRRACKHRLVIAEDFSDKLAIAQLCTGAEKVTVIGLSDTFGKADFSEFLSHAEFGEVAVEHIRSRITRFSERYLEIHAATREISERIAARLARMEGLLNEDDRLSFEITVADHFFFESLKMEAVRDLLKSDEFDHIVVACPEPKSGSKFFQFLAGVETLPKDPRVELISIARRMGSRATFTDRLENMLVPSRPKASMLKWALALSKIKADLDAWAEKVAARMQDFPRGDRQNVLMLTANNMAYNAATAHYAVSLSSNYNVKIGFVGRNASALFSELNTIDPDWKLDNIQFLPTAYPNIMTPLREYMKNFLLELASDTANPMIAHLIQINVDRIARDILKPSLIYHKVINAWFARLAETDSLPDLVVLAPSRVAKVAAFSAVARRHGVPSLTLEAHGLNANYSRYIKIDTDYYGVISEYFRETAESGFGISTERTFVIGSPRIMAPANYDPASARAIARASLEGVQGINFSGYAACFSFFCQPSNWAHVRMVWRNILTACEGLNVVVMLKPHPEDTPSRVAAYISLAKELGMADRVQVLGTDPTTAIEASDLVLTGYSAAAIDAAVLGMPVICVTDGDTDYPVDQHEIIGSMLVRNSADLREIFLKLIKQPEIFREKAEAFLAKEPQFLHGPDENLHTLVAQILSAPAQTALRDANSLPSSLFLSGPHKVFPV